MMIRINLLPFCPLLLVFFFQPLHAQNQWSEFRGPGGEGKAIGAKLPTDLDNPKRLKWKTAIHGKGWSSPVLFDKQVWLTTATPDGKKMSAVCVDLQTGKVIHDLLIHENESPDFCHPTNSYASPTPVIEQGRVYVHFGSYGTTCLDTKTGKKIWQRTDLKCDHHRGPASSPILYDGKLIVAFDGFDLQYVVALDKKTGETVWKSKREIDYGTNNGDLMKAYGTGSVFTINGKPLLVYPSAIATVAYTVDAGKPVWIVYHGGMNASARPLVADNGIMVLTNGMGKMVAFDPRGRGDITKTHIKWSSKRSICKKSTPLIIDDQLYMVNDMGVAQCLSVETGKRLWQARLGGTFSSSPIFDGEHIFAFSEKGEAHIFKPGKKFELVKSIPLADGFKATPAVSGNQLIVRSFSHLYCFANDDAEK